MILKVMENRMLYILKNNGEKLAATKTDAEGESLPKQVRPAGRDPAKLIKPSILGRVPPPALLKPIETETMISNRKMALENE